MLCDRDRSLPQSDADIGSNKCWCCGEQTQLIQHCPKREKGCEWIGYGHGWQQHNAECEFADVECTKCSWRGERRGLSAHDSKECPRRLYRCNYCHDQVPYEEVRTRHLPKCRDYPEPMKEKDQEFDSVLERVRNLEERTDDRHQKVVVEGKLDELQKKLRHLELDMLKKLSEISKGHIEKVSKKVDQQTDKLQKQADDIHRKHADMEQDIRKLRDDIQDIEKKMKELRDDMQRQLVDVKQEMQELREDTLKRLVDMEQKMQKKLRGFEDDMETRFREINFRQARLVKVDFEPYGRSPPLAEYSALLTDEWNTHVADEAFQLAKTN